MANVMLVARTSTADVFRTDARSAGAISNDVDALADTADVAGVQAGDSLSDINLTGEANPIQQQESNVNELSRHEDQFYQGLRAEFDANPVLKGYYETSLIQYRKLLASME